MNGIETLLYCYLVPSLLPSLEYLHILLIATEAMRNDTVLFAAMCLATWETMIGCNLHVTCM